MVPIAESTYPSARKRTKYLTTNQPTTIAPSPNITVRTVTPRPLRFHRGRRAESDTLPSEQERAQEFILREE